MSTRLESAICGMASRYPFHAGLLKSFTFRADPAVGTMGVTIRDGGILCLYAPRFVRSCSRPQLVGVLLHELNHVLFGHLWAQRADFPNRRARVIAEEVTVNEHVHEPLPGTPIVRRSFRLPRNESTLTRYRRLARIIADDGDTGQVDIMTLDNHELWQDAEQNPLVSRGVAALAVRCACRGLGVSVELEPELWRHIYNLRQDGSPCEMETDLDGGQASVDWRQQLRRFAGGILERRAVFSRPPRRFPDMVGILPATSRSASRARVLAVIDTSASITCQCLADISAELLRLARFTQVTVMECDTTIHRVYPLTQPLTSATGRGGTDLRPAFASTELLHGQDLLMYFTDGDGPAPEKAPRIPCLWCLVPGGRKPVPWGRVIEMANRNC